MLEQDSESWAKINKLLTINHNEYDDDDAHNFHSIASFVDLP